MMIELRYSSSFGSSFSSAIFKPFVLALHVDERWWSGCAIGSRSMRYRTPGASKWIEPAFHLQKEHDGIVSPELKTASRC